MENAFHGRTGVIKEDIGGPRPFLVQDGEDYLGYYAPHEIVLVSTIHQQKMEGGERHMAECKFKVGDRVQIVNRDCVFYFNDKMESFIDREAIITSMVTDDLGRGFKISLNIDEGRRLYNSLCKWPEPEPLTTAR
jgi:hypothetical protein